MRFGLFGVSLIFFVSILSASGAQLPLTAKELGLMLRMGYSTSAIEQELSARHFADTLDAAKETQLIQVGAKPELLDALKNGTYSVPAEEIARAKEQLEVQAIKRAQQAEEARKLDTLYQDRLAKERSLPRTQVPSATAVCDFVKGDLVRPYNGTLRHADDEFLTKKKLIVFYFSTYQDPRCRKFTPQLI